MKSAGRSIELDEDKGRHAREEQYEVACRGGGQRQRVNKISQLDKDPQTSAIDGAESSKQHIGTKSSAAAQAVLDRRLSRTFIFGILPLDQPTNAEQLQGPNRPASNEI